jgi:hypothetical protein
VFKSKMIKSKLAVVAGVVGLCASSACFAVTINGGTSAVIDGWQISPDVGVTVQATTSGGDLFLTKTAVFTSDATLNIQFVQMSPGSDDPITLTSESITNSTGGDWTGFTYTVNSQASFGSLSGIFLPPTGVGYNYSAGTVSPGAQTLTYVGTQGNGITSAWGAPSSATPLLLIDPLAIPGSGAGFTLGETPTGSPPVTAVPLPAAVWETSAMLLGLGVVGAWRKVLKA